jgi:membrane protein DedA with SNARE-associated domain
MRTAPSTLADVTNLLLQYGLVLLFAMVAIESAGVPIPGETALITAAFFARPEYHHWSLISVIVVAAGAAIIGDNIGYALGRFGGRALIDRWAFAKRYADKALPPSERFFRKHGAKTVFFGRFIALLRVTAAWLAGISHMPWWRFFMWNAAGGIVWATGVSVLADLAGQAVAETIQKYGLYGVLALLVLGVAGFFAVRFWRKRIIEEA